ncbi:MAG TPA: hypothetical protein DEB31_01775 [Clostridiales bacterium]|nr:hypothetical protein [Clostridiales bacterium]
MHEAAYESKAIEVIQVVIVLVIIASMLLPMLTTAAQAQPSADDAATFGEYMRFRGEGANQLQSALKETFRLYSTGQGAFLTGLLSGLPSGASAVALFCCLVVGGFFLSVFIAVKNVIRYVFDCHRLSLILWVYLGLIFLMTQCTNPAEAFFWYAGAVRYTLPAMAMFFGIGVALKSFRYKRPGIRFWQFTGSAALLFFACGGSLVIAAFLCWIVFLGAVSAFLYKAPFRGKLLFLLAVCAAGLWINLLAPGSAPAALGSGLPVAARAPWVLPAFLAFVLPVLFVPVRSIAERSGFAFAHPLRCVVFSLTAVVPILVPLFTGYSDGMGQAYVQCATWLIFALVFFNYVYLVGARVKARA